MSPRHPDFLVIGGGIVGLSLALALQRRFAGAQVWLLEKEPALGRHASGRNSGVLHAGFYYAADSLKARFCRDGNRELTAYCRERGLPLDPCGKLVVARTAADLAALDELLRRAEANGVPLEPVSPAEAQKIEPRVKTYQRALFSPTTAAVDPLAVLESLAGDFQAAGGRLLLGTAYLGRERRPPGGEQAQPDGAGLASGRESPAGPLAIRTTAGVLEPGYLVNAAGLYADRIARDFGFARRYGILPFKGLYLLGEPEAGPLATHVYPVPDLGYPFLGVHVTVTVRGQVKIGPTAIPAWWREQYRGLGNFRPAECWEILRRQFGLWWRNDFGFRRLALAELVKYSRRHLVRLAGELVAGVELRHYRRWGTPGIRAQLVDLEERRLVMDFCLEGDDRSFHVLNAVSPAFTSALPFGRWVAEQIERARSGSPPAGPGSSGSPPAGPGSSEPLAGPGSSEPPAGPGSSEPPASAARLAVSAPLGSPPERPAVPPGSG